MASGAAMQASGCAALMLSPLPALLLFGALHCSWSRVETEAEGPSLRARFTLAEGCMRVRFWPDRLHPKPVPEPLRVPWVPLQQLVAGPPALARFRRQLLRPGQRVDVLGAMPGDRDMEFVVKNLDRAVRCREWDPTFFRPFDAASAATHLATITALGLNVAAMLSHVLGLALHRRALRLNLQYPKQWKSVLVLRLSGSAYIAAAVVIMTALTRYTAVCHHRLKVLVSEFVLGITAGDVNLWPQDLAVHLAPGVYCALTGAVLSFLLGMFQLSAEFVASEPAAVRAQAQAEVRQVRSELEEDAESDAEEESKREDREYLMRALETTRVQLKAHNRRVAGTVILAIIAFVALLCAVAFFLGRVAVAQGIQNALRGPQLTVKQTTLSFRKAREFAKDVVVGAGNATAVGVWTATRQTWGATRHAQRELRELGRDAKRKAQHVAQAVQSPDWRQVAGNILALPGRFTIRGLRSTGRGLSRSAQHAAAGFGHGISLAGHQTRRAAHNLWKRFRMQQLRRGSEPEPPQRKWPWKSEKPKKEEPSWFRRLLPGRMHSVAATHSEKAFWRG
ncbi:unnamed protein product [Effrenium voratum]|nr:unnamed protein product [Effrenium voratum]